MLISARSIRYFWNLKPSHLVHIGAHLLEEREDYSKLGWGSTRTIWIEGDEHRAKTCEDMVAGLSHHRVLHAVLSDTDGETVAWHEATNGQSSGILPPEEHLGEYPEIHFSRPQEVLTTRFCELRLLDDVQSGVFCNLDIQGAELLALRGFGHDLKKVDSIYCEVNIREIYKNCARLEELDGFLAGEGFTRVDIQMTSHGWGDALYIRQSVVPNQIGLRRKLRRLYSLGEAIARTSGALARKVKSAAG